MKTYTVLLKGGDGPISVEVVADRMQVTSDQCLVGTGVGDETVFVSPLENWVAFFLQLEQTVVEVTGE